MPDLFDLFARWWKQILLLPLLSLVVVGVLTFLKPRQYLSVATAVPASSFAADKSAVFNQNIQALYSTFGTPDDLDRILGTAGLDTIYTAVATRFNLYDHYKVKEKGPDAVSKSAALLRKNTKVQKSNYGELKVKVWDTDPQLAPQLANAILEQLSSHHRDLQSAGNEATLDGLRKAREKLMHPADSAGNLLELAERVRQYDQLISEYQLMVDSKPPALLVVERAKKTNWPDRPKTFRVLAATALLSFLFSLLAALLLDRKKTPAP